MGINSSASIFGLLFLLLMSGCHTTDDRTPDDPGDAGDEAAFLHGSWIDRTYSDSDSLYDSFFFGKDGGFDRIVRTTGDEFTYGGQYSVTDSMIRITILADGIPSEEVWLRFRKYGDSLELFKGIQLTGTSQGLMGDWYCETKVADSSGRKVAYEYAFTPEGLFIMKTNTFTDTSKFVENGDGITVYDKSGSNIRYTLFYEINGNRLSIYNIGAKTAWTKEKAK